MNSHFELLLREYYPELTSVQARDEFNVVVGFGCGDGWYPLLIELLGMLDDARLRGGGDIHIAEVKQKFGRLNIYFSCYDFKFGSLEYALFNALCAHLSIRTCEICGASGQRRNKNGYFIALCDEHNNNWSNIKCYLKETGDLALDLKNYQRNGLDTERKVYIKTSTEAVSEDNLHITLYDFPNRIVSVRNEPLHHQLKVSIDETVTIGEAHHIFTTFQRDGRLLNYYWPIELSLYEEYREC